MQRERVRRVWYGAPQGVGIGLGSADVRWFCVGGSFAVIGACHMEQQGCNDDAYHRFLGCPNAAANAVDFGLPQGAAAKKAQNEALAVVTH